MAKNLKRVLAIGATLALSASTLAACGGASGGKINIDPNKSQLYVYSFAGGFGTSWISDAATRYEQANADRCFEPGTAKKGIQIIPTNNKNGVSATTVKNGVDAIYFVEGVDLYGELYANNAIADITPAVTGVNPYETGKTLESKLYDDQKSYLGLTKNGETKYYGLPHYFTSFGVVYDIDLFNKFGYYFLETPLIDDVNSPLWLKGQFQGTANQDKAKSKGPNGKTGVDEVTGEDYSADDGLPATYEEFFMLCQYIKEDGKMPINWTGKYYDGYIGHVYNALVADYEGYEQMRLNFTLKGTATNLGTIEDGQFVEDAEDTEIGYTENGNKKDSNAYELRRQAGKYYALKFIEELFSKNYVTENANAKLFSNSYTHLQAQTDFLMSEYDGKPIAMLAEGNWWESEATATFNKMTQIDKKYSKENRNFGWMPLPKANEEKVGEKNTLYDIMYPMTYVKAGLPEWEYNAAIDFLQFLNTDESLQKFNEITGVPKAMKYEVKDFSKMSTYAKTMYNAMKYSDIVFPYAGNDLFMNNQAMFAEFQGKAYHSTCGEQNPNVVLHTTNYTAAQIFSGMYEFAKKQKIWTIDVNAAE